MSSRAEEQRTILIAERSVVWVGCHGVSTGFLLRETDVVLYAVLLCILSLLVSHFLFEELQMLMAHGEMHISLIPTLCIESALYEMFLHRSARTFRIVVEEQQTLWQLSVVESALVQHVLHYSLVVALGDEFLDSLAIVLLAHLIQSTVEGELLNVVEILLLKVGCRHIIVGIEESEHVLEHAACCSAGRNKLHNLLSLCLIVVPCLHIVLALSLCRSHDAIAYSGRSFQTEEWESGFKLLQLVLDLLRCYSFLSDLF